LKTGWNRRRQRLPVEAVEERRFKVGELVEYWGGAMVRGYRTDSGEPAWVKADYGGGVYGIKMVANTRGNVWKKKMSILGHHSAGVQKW